MAASLLLDIEAWDLCLDARGYWAIADDPYAIAQNVACIGRLIVGEASYDTTRGIPYWTEIFTAGYPLDLIKSDFEVAAEMIDGVNSAVLYITAFSDRSLSGQIQLATDYGPLYASV